MSEFAKIPNLSVDEYLALEEQALVRHEYVHGQIFAMTGATDAHNVICGNIYAMLHAHLRGSGCLAYINDMKLKIQQANSFYYPDIMVTCEPFDAESVIKQQPVLIVEVLAPSTKHIDRREKLIAYKQIDSLQQYLMIHQNKYRIDSYRRDSDNHWEVSSFGIANSLVLISRPSILEVPITSIYEGVALDLTVEEEDEDYELSHA
jgi:Uma2 family endonuclease